MCCCFSTSIHNLFALTVRPPTAQNVQNVISIYVMQYHCSTICTYIYVQHTNLSDCLKSLTCIVFKDIGITS